ncbi:hypothetical protein DFJ74DRAFT_766447 [Hyaloraphidium curvatum]|nr:hypothetical protein DFJ74DRAFT_766447 [Hyaloraphidium curvatum]
MLQAPWLGSKPALRSLFFSIVLASCLWLAFPTRSASKGARNASAAHRRGCHFPQLAVAVKTGRAVARWRLPPVLSTYARDLCGLLLVADGGGEFGGSVVADGFAGAFEEAGKGKALIGRGGRDFIVRTAGKAFRAVDVVGDAGRRADREIHVLHRESWAPGEWERLRRKAVEGSEALSDAAGMAAKDGPDADAPEPPHGAAPPTGWDADAAKHLPAFAELFNRHPGARWFLMFDDDAYPFLPTLSRHLATLNHSEPHYLGRAHTGACPQNVVFAHGGTGIILSRGAVLRALPALEVAMKHATCFSGDLRVASWMSLAGIQLTWAGLPPRMHLDPLLMWESYPRACDLALSVHHVPPHLFRALRALETAEGAKHFVTNADLWHAFSPSFAGVDAPGHRIEKDANRPGQDTVSLSRAPPGMGTDEFDLYAKGMLDTALRGERSLPQLDRRLLDGLAELRPKFRFDPHLHRRAALAVLCAAACAAVRTPGRIRVRVPVGGFHNRTAEPVGRLPARGPCTMWSMDGGDVCHLKSGFGGRVEDKGVWSGLVKGAGGRYAAVGKKGPAARRCGWTVVGKGPVVD